MPRTRRHIVLSALAAGFGAAGAARAAAWRPTRPVTVIVPYPAGGGTDVLARVAARELGAAFGASFVVENAPGASGALGSRRVARAEADGHTLLVTTNQTHATNISLLRDGGGYDPVRDFTVLGGLADLQHVLVVRADLDAADVAGLLSRSRSEPALTCGSTGPGSASHLTLELFQAKTGAKLVHVPYRGAAPLLQDLIGGRIDMSFATIPTVLEQVRAGRLRALAMASPEASAHLPDVPVLARAGVEGVEADAWIAAFAPANLPGEIKAALSSALDDILRRDAVREVIAFQGMRSHWRPPEDFATFQRRDIERWAAIIRAANLALE